MQPEDSQIVTPQKGYSSQFFSSLVACITTCVCIYAMGYSSPVIPELQDAGLMTDDQASWYGSICNLGAMFGGFLGGFVMDVGGRRTAVLATLVPTSFGLFLQTIIRNIYLLCLGRMIVGLGIGMNLLVVSVYVSEVTSPEVRGQLVTLMQVLGSLGVILVNLFGIFIDVQYLAVLGNGICAACSIAIVFIPESPRWLVSRGFMNQARKESMKLKLNFLDVGVKKSDSNEGPSDTVQESMSFKEFFSPNLMKPLSIVIILLLFQMANGINCVVFYTETIFLKAGLTGSFAKYSSIMVGGALMLSCVLSSQLIDRLGRRILLIISSVTAVIASTTLGVFFYLQEEKNVQTLGWLAIVGLVVFCFGYNLGWAPIPYLMISEMLPIKAVGIGGGLGIVLNWSASFAITKAFPVMVESSIGSYGAFWVLAGINLAALLFVIIFLPETKGKILNQDQMEQVEIGPEETPCIES